MRLTLIRHATMLIDCAGRLDMQAVNRCPETRADPSRTLEQAGVEQRVRVPADGESLPS